MLKLLKKLLGIKRLRTIGEIDTMSLEEADSQLSNNEPVVETNSMPNIEAIISRYKTCKKCDGTLNVIEPERMLGNKRLMQCSNCGDREYKLIGERSINES